MGTITFDTQELVRELRSSGIPQEQAEAVVRTIVKSHAELVTQGHFDLKLEKELGPIKADLLVLKWMMGVLIAVALANFAKQFF
jgi:hypothetical protein